MLYDWLERAASAVTSKVAPASLPRLQERRILRLLGRRPMTTRELERHSGVPRDRVYEILGRLYEQRTILTAPSGIFWSPAFEGRAPGPRTTSSSHESRSLWGGVRKIHG